jgi:PAS domain S-box-containing protein
MDVGEALRQAEDRYRILLEQAPIGVFLYDRDLCITESNQRFAEILGSEVGRLVGLDMTRLRDQKVLPTLRAALEGRAEKWEGWYEATTGTATVYVTLRVVPRLDRDGAVVGGIGIVDDLTDRIVALEALRTSEQRLALYVRESPLGLVVWDPEGRVVEWNPAATRIFGHSPPEAFGRPWTFLEAPGSDGAMRAMMEALLAGRGGDHATLEHVRKDGARITCLWRSASLVDAAGKVIGAASIVDDVTERREMEAKLRKTDRMVAVGTLAAGVAHEVNNPLAYLKANLDIAVGRKLPALRETLERIDGEGGAAARRQLGEIEEMLALAREGAERVRVIVNDLKTFARADDGTRQLCDVDHVLDAAIQMAKHEIRERATLVREDGETPLVLANQARLGQVFLNLLLNAAQALPKGSPAAHQIRVATTTDARGRCVVTVADTGPGIDAAIQARIFDPFFTTKPREGTGLGLWIARQITESIGGEIAVQSEPGHGACFTVTLPPAEVGVAASVEAAAPPHVLVVDDEPAIARAIAAMIGSGHAVSTATTGEEALACLRGGAHFDLVLCDLMMPGTSGIDVYETIARERPEMADRFVFITGGAVSERAEEFCARMQGRTLAKPFGARELRAFLPSARTS